MDLEASDREPIFLMARNSSIAAELYIFQLRRANHANHKDFSKSSVVSPNFESCQILKLNGKRIPLLMHKSFKLIRHFSELLVNS